MFLLHMLIHSYSISCKQQNDSGLAKLLSENVSNQLRKMFWQVKGAITLKPPVIFNITQE